MKKLLAGLMVAATMISFVGVPTHADAKMTSKMTTKHVKYMKCPFCGMQMPTKKTATMYVPVKIKGVTYYCCPECKGGKSGKKA